VTMAFESMALETLPISFLVDKALLDAMLYLVFFFFLVISVGSTYLATLSEIVGIQTRVSDYDACGYLYAKQGVICSAVTFISLIALTVSSIVQPTLLSSFFYPVLFSGPLILLVGLLMAELLLVTVYMRTWTTLAESRRAHLLLASSSSVFSTGALLSFLLIHTYTLAPQLPEGLIAVLRPASLDWGGQLALMVNRSWLPMTLKMSLVGSLTAALIVSAVAVLRYRKAPSSEAEHHLRFQANWGFKIALLFGAPVGIIGYWNAAIFHTATPTLALGLMGSTSGGLSEGLASTASPLWHLGVIGAMILAAAAIAFYLDLDMKNSRPKFTRQIAIQRLVLLSMVLWALATFGALDTSTSYPAQGILTIPILLGGYFISLTLWLYSKGRVRLRVPILLFALAVIALLLYVGQYNSWYLAAQYGGVPWPPVAFLIATPTAFLVGRKMRLRRYVLILISAMVAPLVLLAKFMDVAFLKGSNIVAIDPSAKAAIDSWAYENYVNLDPLSTTYAIVTPEQAVLAIIVGYAAFILLMFCAYRFTKPGRKMTSETGRIAID
jgi:hypothetical protein